jgi:hypothetical protein
MTALLVPPRMKAARSRTCRIAFLPNDPADEHRPAVRGHGDQVAASGGRRVDDRLIGVLVLHMDRVAGDARRLGLAGRLGEDAPGALLDVALIFGWRVGELVRLQREGVERLGDRQRRHAGADRLGELQSLIDRLGGQFRAVGRDENVPVHGLSPESSDARTRHRRRPR